MSVPVPTTPPASVGLGALTSSVDPDGSASCTAFTGRKVILNFRLGGAGALDVTGGDGIGGTASSNSNSSAAAAAASSSSGGGCGFEGLDGNDSTSRIDNL